MLIKITAIVMFLALGVLFYPQSSEALLEGANFELPIEKDTSKYAVTSDMSGTATNMPTLYWNQFATSRPLLGLLQAGFYLTVFLSLLSFGAGNVGAGKDLIIYLATFGLLTLPIPFPGTSGGPILVLFANASDAMTLNILNSLGFNKNNAKSFSNTFGAFQYANDKTLSDYKTQLSNFDTICYQPARARQAASPLVSGVPPALDYNFDPSAPTSDTPPTVAFATADFDTTTAPTITCADMKTKIAADMQAAYQGQLVGYAIDHNFPLETKDSLKNAVPSDPNVIFDYGMTQVTAAGPKTDFRNAKVTARYIQLFTQIRPMLIATGSMMLLVFDEYIFDIVVVIKSIAAAGMVLGVVYFSFFRKLEIPLTALGVWIMGNGLHVVANLGLQQIFRPAIASSTGSSIGNVGTGISNVAGLISGYILGTSSKFEDALIMMAFVGSVGSVLASILSWKGISAAVNFMGSGHLRLGGRSGNTDSGNPNKPDAARPRGGK